MIIFCDFVVIASKKKTERWIERYSNASGDVAGCGGNVHSWRAGVNIMFCLKKNSFVTRCQLTRKNRPIKKFC